MRACWVGQWILFTVLILTAGPVQAEWVALEARYQTHPLQTAYIDRATFEREGSLVTLPLMIDWKTMQGGRASNRFSSTKVIKQFDCEAQRVRALGSTDYYGQMGTGEVIGGGGYASEHHWAAVEQGTLDQGLWEVACGKR